MRRHSLIRACALSLLLAIPCLAAGTFKSDFGGKGLTGWRVVNGDWRVVKGELRQEAKGWGRRMILAPVRLEEGTLRVRMRVDQASKTSGAGFGLLLRHPGAKTYTVLRLGTYGMAGLMQPVKDARICGFTPKVGTYYDVKVELVGDTLALFIDGKKLGSAKLTEATAPGAIGFYTENPATFADLEVTGAWRPTQREPAQKKQQPAPKTQRPDPNAFRNDFSKKALRGWYTAGGSWKVVEGELRQEATDWGRYMLLPPVRLEQGTLRARMRADQGHKPGGACFGFALRYPGAKTFTILRLGAYGAAGLMQPVKDASIRRFKPEIGRYYDVKAELAGDTVTLFIDGKKLGSARMTEAKAPGTIGFYTENQARFDNLEVSGTWRLTRKEPALGEGKPRLDIRFTEWRPVSLDPTLSFSVSGALQIYYKNTGTADAVLDHVKVLDKKADRYDSPPWIVYARQHPRRLKPGETGQLEVRLNGLPKAVALRILENPGGPARLPVVIVPRGGKAVRTSVDIAGRSEVQINFMAFSEDLKTLYVYVQNNKAAVDGAGKPVALTGIEVNGVDMTRRARFGARTVFRDVVPIVVSLPKALPMGPPVLVTVATADGKRTGHALRVFPSKFNILVCYNSAQARKDYLEDIYNHCVTAVNSFRDRAKCERLGFDLIPMGSPSVLTRMHTYRNSPVRGVWMDEVDKGVKGYDVLSLLRAIEDGEDMLRGFAVGEIPLVCFNLCNPGSSAQTGYMTLPDAVMHSYGFFMCPRSRRGFGRLSTLPAREYRLARRPFWPYYRDSEIAVPRDPVKKVMLPRNKAFQRCLTPKEQRWLTYGNLIQGAKSMAHWGYWAGPMSKFYFMWKQSVLRLGLGAPADDRVGPYKLERAVADMLKTVWSEHGRINAELRTIGPLVAISDVSYLAKVTKVEPKTDRYGDPAAEAAALVSGLDTLVVVVLNHDIKPAKVLFSGTGPLSNPAPPTYDPVHATVDVRIPEWIKPAYVFSVDHQRVADVSLTEKGGALRFVVPRLEVSKLYVITSSRAVKEGCLARHAEMRKRLVKMAATVPVYNPGWRDRDLK